MAIIKGPVNPVISGTTTFPDLKSVQVTAPNRHSVKPSLVLDFANSKTLDPRVPFTRGSSATYYDGTTALAEQNLITYSSDITNSDWGNVALTSKTANAAVAPDGTTTADQVTGTAGTSYKLVGHNAINGSTYAYSAGLYYTFSCYVKYV